MKKSNKILLAGFLIGLSFITAIHVTLYAKYKAGNYTIYNVEENQKPDAMQTFPNILFVWVRNVPDATVIFGDVAEVEKSDESGIVYVQKGDTLHITGSDSGNHEDYGHQVVLNIPYSATLSVFNSFVSFKGGKKIAEGSPVIYLQRSQALFSGTKTPLQFGNIKVVASDSSAVMFNGNTQVKNLEVRLANSSIEYTDGDFGQLSIVTDSESRISLQSKHLLKAKINTISQ